MTGCARGQKSAWMAALPCWQRRTIACRKEFSGDSDHGLCCPLPSLMQGPLWKWGKVGLPKDPGIKSVRIPVLSVVLCSAHLASLSLKASPLLLSQLVFRGLVFSVTNPLLHHGRRPQPLQEV